MKHNFKLIMCVLAATTFAVPALAVEAVNVSATLESAEYTLKRQQRDELKAEVARLNSEISRCKRTKTNWTAATVVGGVGVVGTTVGIIVQANQVKDKKQELKSLQGQ